MVFREETTTGVHRLYERMEKGTLTNTCDKY